MNGIIVTKRITVCKDKEIHVHEVVTEWRKKSLESSDYKLNHVRFPGLAPGDKKE